MPNESNATAPIILIAPGRSGTSLLSAILARHSQVEFVGETSEMIFGFWQAMEATRGIVRKQVENGKVIEFDELASRTVRQNFVTYFNSPRPRWMQKPIGIPDSLVRRGVDENDMPDARWYWGVLKACFPDAKYLTILRRPADVVRSSMRYWGFDERSVWWGLACTSHLLAHETSPVHFAVDYADLVSDRQDTCRRILDYCELAFEPDVMRAFDTIHAPQKITEDEKSVSEPLQIEIKPCHLDAIGRVRKKFGFVAELPEFPAPLPQGTSMIGGEDKTTPFVEGCQPGETPTTDQFFAAIKAREKTIESLNQQIRDCHRKHNSELTTMKTLIEKLNAQTSHRG